MSIFDDSDTLCNRENNKCKLRNKCLRYMKVEQNGDWTADYWQEYGKFCEEKGHFLPMKKKEVIDGPLSQAGQKAQEEKGD
jgi:hypothetical protein